MNDRPAEETGSGTRELQRFLPVEIALHWSVVLPYIVLAASGVWLLLEKNLGFELVTRRTLVLSHKTAGVALVVLPLLVLVCTSPKPFLKTALEALRFGPRDLWWLHASALRLFLPRLRLPRQGRFNAGQKLNILHVAFLLPLVAVSGAALWFGSSAVLLVRMSHAGGAALSVCLAAGHMYLALVHPSTRAARGAMFHGRVSADYASHHHPLWFEELTGETAPVPAADEAPVLSKLGITLLLITTALVTLGSLALAPAPRPGRARRVLERYLTEPRNLLLPAPLHPTHREEKALARCGACHDSSFDGVKDELCLRCHEEVDRRMAERIGYHGTLRGNCADCHEDHRPVLITLDEKAFNHDQALFRLEGAHRDVTCDECHRRDGARRRRYLEVEHDGCRSCHRDPHAPSLEESCSHCHREESWSRLAASFDHDHDTAFCLAGAHRGLECGRCHSEQASGPPRLRGTPTACSGCHDDPHDRPDADCGTCHTQTSSWAAPGFDHALQSRFVLDERHRAVACDRCHLASRGVVFRYGPEDLAAAGDGFSCESCHGEVAEALSGRFTAANKTEPSPHYREVKCQECHKTTPAIETARCSGCHPSDYDALFIDWQSNVELELLRRPSGEAERWRLQGKHHWEGAMQALRTRSR